MATLPMLLLTIHWPVEAASHNFNSLFVLRRDIFFQFSVKYSPTESRSWQNADCVSNRKTDQHLNVLGKRIVIWEVLKIVRLVNDKLPGQNSIRDEDYDEVDTDINNHTIAYMVMICVWNIAPIHGVCPFICACYAEGIRSNGYKTPDPDEDNSTIYSSWSKEEIIVLRMKRGIPCFPALCTKLVSTDTDGNCSYRF